MTKINELVAQALQKVKEIEERVSGLAREAVEAIPPQETSTK